MFQSSGEITTHIVSLAVAYALAFPVGWDREKDARSAGIRTFPLVAIASCGFVLVGIAILGRTSPAQARLLEGLITGVGFIGGGAILKGGKASGTATAASRRRLGRSARPWATAYTTSPSS
jgi:putative Mg2+ transporter-C (MgtC) family protein